MPAAVPSAVVVLGRLRAANAAVAAWLAAPSDAAWAALRQELAAMDACAPLCPLWRDDGAVAREAETYQDQLRRLRSRLRDWQQELRGRRAQLQRSRSDLEGLRAWRDALENTAP